MNGISAQCVNTFDKHALDEFVIEQSLTINELVQHPRGNLLRRWFRGVFLNRRQRRGRSGNLGDGVRSFKRGKAPRERRPTGCGDGSLDGGWRGQFAAQNFQRLLEDGVFGLPVRRGATREGGCSLLFPVRLRRTRFRWHRFYFVHNSPFISQPLMTRIMPD